MPTTPDDYTPGPEEALAEAQRLIDAGRPFHAHEVLEARWKCAPDAERELWQGLAQLAVGLTHIQRGNLKGAAALLRRGSLRVESSREPYGVDVPRLVRRARELIDRLEGGEIPADLRIELVARLC
ncbi:DUF309 domain-containing protein [Rhizohabitans arisaemae]|uniref:DUF309 domain-containing protein n=1 Tax=Rhizohabitans arisaemae TaxID=2720610 RepID=UPI0031FEA057